MKPPNEKLKLINVVPGKFYIKDRPGCETPFDLITFLCSEERGGLRGFVRLFSGNIEIFPTTVVRNPSRGRLNVRAIDLRTKVTYALEVEFDRYSGELVLSTKSVLVDPDLDEIETNIKWSIEDKEREIQQLRNACELLKLL